MRLNDREYRYALAGLAIFTVAAVSALGWPGAFMSIGLFLITMALG